MTKAPRSADEGPLPDPLGPLGHMLKLMTVLTFRLLEPPWRAIPETLVGISYRKAPQGLKKVTPGGDFQGKGGIPKVVPPLYEEGPPQCWHRSGFGSARQLRPHAKINDGYTF